MLYNASRIYPTGDFQIYVKSACIIYLNRRNVTKLPDYFCRSVWYFSDVYTILNGGEEGLSIRYTQQAVIKGVHFFS